MKTLAGVPGFSIGGVHSGDYGIYLVDKIPDLLPKTRDYEVPIYGRNGQYDFGTDLDFRPILLNLAMLGSDRQDLLDNLRAFVSQIDPIKGYQQLIFDDDPGRYYLAKYTSATSEPQLKFTINRADFSLGFKCDDPLIYSVSPQKVTWSATANGSTTIANYGSRETPVTLTLTTSTAVTNVQIDINGIHIIYSGTINPSDTVVIDTGEMTYTKNGQNAIQYWQGDFPHLQPGQNTIDSSAALNIVLTYRERWL